MTSFATFSQCQADAIKAWLPPPELSLSEWADEHFYLSPESSAETGRWHTLPYQKGIMDAITDPAVTQVTLIKSARVGYTKMVNAAVGYYIHQAPCSVLVVQPTVDDAKGYSKEEIAPMLRDCPALAQIVFEEAEETGPKDSGNTMLHKKFPGGVLSLVGANSGSGFRRVSRKVVIFDEVDGYPPSAGSEGDQIKLGIKRTEYFWDRKIIAGSTPLIAGHSRIEEMFEQGDQRRYYVPCPHCGHMDYLVFSERETGGHFLQWPEGKPEEAHFVCKANGCVIEHHQKREMVERGEWRSAQPFSGHASFHIWAGYSYSPNASWATLAKEFLEVKGNSEKLKTFVNTVLGETWKERGEAPDYERLYARRETYQIGTVPEGVKFLTAGVDVQKDRVEYEVVGWGVGKQSWSVDAGAIPFLTSSESEWVRLDELLNRTFPTVDGDSMRISMLAVDAGYNTQQAYNWARMHVGRVLAIKGVDTAKTILGSPTPVDVTIRGKRIARGCKVWPVGSSIAKSELYGWLSLPTPDGEFPPGFCHFPEYDKEYFKQLTSEHLVTTVNRKGFAVREWHVLPERQNHGLDRRIYARAAATLIGLDRSQVATKPAEERPEPVARREPQPRRPGTWLGIGNTARKGSWLNKKR